MKGHNYWSYAPYKPLDFDVGDPYICRVVPYLDSIHFEWLGNGKECEVFYRVRNEGEFISAGKTTANEFDITGLEAERDYEFFASSGDGKSRIRLARTGHSVGVTVNYLHPEDNAYIFSGKYLASPSLVRHPDGYLLTSMDVFEGNAPQNFTMIFRSDDDGESWHYVSELIPCFWGKLFIHRGELYMLSISTDYGDLLIGKSTDGGKTFTPPVALLRGAGGKKGRSGYHKNPQNIFEHNGRIYESLEWGTWDNKEYGHAAMVMSASVDADLLDPESWSFTPPKKFGHFAPELEQLPMNTMTIEGTIVLSPENKLYNVMRFGMEGKVIAYEIDQNDPEAPLEYSHLISLPTSYSKFMIKRDDVSGKYYSIVTRSGDNNPHFRNVLSLAVSDDMKDWEIATNLLDYGHCDHMKVGFQYVDFYFEGDDIIYLCRTGINEPHNYHDSNYQTFHRVKNFREL